MRNFILISFVSIMTFSSCKDHVQDYYVDQNQTTTNGTLWECLSANPEYSEFAALVKQFGLVEMLNGENLLTVWAPTNSTMPESINDLSDKGKLDIVRNHICNSIIYSRNFSKIKTVKTFSHKYLAIVMKPEGYSIDGSLLINYDKLCENGIVHEVSQWLMPRLNLYEWVESLGDEFSMFRDSLMARNLKKFDKENSEIIGVDDDGRVIYDSIFIIENEVLMKGDITNESKRFTMFVPDNDAFLDMYEQTHEYLETLEYPTSMSDTLMWVDWILKASIFNGEVKYEAAKTIKSVHNKEFRTDFQIAEYMDGLSNGIAYRLSSTHIPRSIYFKNTVFNPYFIRSTAPSKHEDNDGLDSWSLPIAPVVSNFFADTETVYFQFEKTVSRPSYKFTSCNYNNDQGLFKVNVMPGNYKIKCRLISFQSEVVENLSDSIELSINGAFIAMATGIRSNKYNITDGALVTDNVYISGVYGPATIEAVVPDPDPVKVPSVDRPHRRLCIGKITLIPTDNY